MRILIISYAFEPIYSACSVRWGSIARAMSRQGHEVRVLCAWQPGIPEREVIDGVNVIRAASAWHARLRSGLRARAARSNGGGSGPSGSALSWVNANLWHGVMWPDHATMWQRPARREAVRLLNDGCDLLISVALPFTSHLVAKWALEHSAGPRPTWVVENGDPFSLLTDTPPNNRDLYEGRNRRAEQKVLTMADVVVVPNKEMLDHYLTNGFPGIEAKAVVIPHVMSGTRSASRPATNDASVAGELKFVYAGSFARGVRTPDRMLAGLAGAFARLEDHGISAHLDLFGDLGDCAGALDRYRAEVEAGRFRIHGRVSPIEAAAALERADLLVNAGNRTLYRQPSKLVDYMCLGKPIVHFAEVTDDVDGGLLADYPAVCLVSAATDLKAAGAEMIAAFAIEQPVPDASFVAALSERHSDGHIARSFAELAVDNAVVEVE